MFLLIGQFLADLLPFPLVILCKEFFFIHDEFNFYVSEKIITHSELAIAFWILC